jgi:hypothetical protein
MLKVDYKTNKLLRGKARALRMLRCPATSLPRTPTTFHNVRSTRSIIGPLNTYFKALRAAFEKRQKGNVHGELPPSFRYIVDNNGDFHDFVNSKRDRMLVDTINKTPFKPSPIRLEKIRPAHEGPNDEEIDLV